MISYLTTSICKYQEHIGHNLGELLWIPYVSYFMQREWVQWRPHHIDIDEALGSKVHGANMGSIWGRQVQGGPHVGPMNFAIW